MGAPYVTLSPTLSPTRGYHFSALPSPGRYITYGLNKPNSRFALSPGLFFREGTRERSIITPQMETKDNNYAYLLKNLFGKVARPLDGPYTHTFVVNYPVHKTMDGIVRRRVVNAEQYNKWFEDYIKRNSV